MVFIGLELLKAGTGHQNGPSEVLEPVAVSTEVEEYDDEMQEVERNLTRKMPS